MRNPLGQILTVPIAVFLLAASAHSPLESSKPSATGTPRTLNARTFEFTYRVTVTEIPGGTQELRIWLPYPRSDRNQEISDMQIKSPADEAVYNEPEHGNSILYLSLHQVKLPVEVEMKFKVRRREYPRTDFHKIKATPHSDTEAERFLKPERLVPITDEVRHWARDVTKGQKTDLEKVRAIYDYAIAILKYDKSGKGWGRGDILYACNEKRGNCTEFHALFTGFCRAVGVPARFEIGFLLPEDTGAGEIEGYHCWAQFYLRGYGWVPVDASEAWKHPEKREYFFGSLDENRVLFTVGRDIELRPLQRGDFLNYFIDPYVEADGKPIPVGRKFYFKALLSG